MSEELKSVYSKANELFERGQYNEAELLLVQVLESNPNYADVLNKLGVIYELKGRKEKAREHFEKALAINPNYTEAALNLAITLSDLGDAEQAQEVLVNIREVNKDVSGDLDPFVAGKLANEHFRLGNIYYDFTLLDEAIEQYERAIKLRPGLADIQTKYGVALRERGRPDEAMEQFVAAKKARTDYCPAMIQLGLSYYRKGMKDEAVKEWQSALEVEPDNKEAETFLDLAKKG
jgi:tetratricopeptide (TPR) repeat protein